MEVVHDASPKATSDGEGRQISAENRQDVVNDPGNVGNLEGHEAKDGDDKASKGQGVPVAQCVPLAHLDLG